MTVPQTIALVDLSCIFKKNFHANPPNGGAKTLAELVAIRESVAHTILCLDSKPYARREKIFAGYKANRPPMADEEKYQRRWLHEQLKKGGWQTAKVEGEEADDVIASLARVYELWGAEVQLVGADKDLAQCVTEKVRQLVPAVGERPAELRGPARVLEKFGVRPDQIPLYLALVGDKSDNVPGVPGIGEVKAVALIAEHGDFASLSQALTLRPGKPSGIWKSLADNWTQFEMSLELVVLRRDLGLDALALLDKLEPEPVVETMAENDVELGVFTGNETPMPVSPSLAAQIAAEHAKLNVLMSAEPAKSERPQPIIGKDPKADQVLRDLAAQRHEREQEREEEWRKQMREENEAAERLADNRAAANDQKPASGPRGVPDAEFDPIGKSPGASGPMPPKPAPVVSLPMPINANLKGLARLRAPFEKHQVSKLPKGTKDQNNCQPSEKRNCNVCGGWHHPKIIHLDYVGHAALTDRLLEADPMWTWEPMAVAPNGLPLFDPSGGLWIRLTVCGVTRLGYGHAASKNAQDPGSREKEIIGDALRNAAMRFGAALELWHKGDDLHDEDWDAAAAWAGGV